MSPRLARNLKTAFRVLCILVACGNFAVAAMLLLEGIARSPNPNVGRNPREAAWLLIPSAVIFCGFLFQQSKTRAFKMAAASWVAFLLTMIVIDQFNLLVEYDIWLFRGLPASGTPPWKVERSDGGSFWDEW
jgi:hypothetical protein